MINNNFTTIKIDFLHEIDHSLSIDKSARNKYIKLDSWGLSTIGQFIDYIDDNDIFLIFPFLTATQRPADPYLRLSPPFLVTRKSSVKLISNFLSNQFLNSGFNLSDDYQHHFYIKTKKVYISNTKY